MDRAGEVKEGEVMERTHVNSLRLKVKGRGMIRSMKRAISAMSRTKTCGETLLATPLRNCRLVSRIGDNVEGLT